MLEINVMFWNIEDFGFRHDYRGFAGTELCAFIAEAVDRAEVDVLLIQELRCRQPGSASMSSALTTLSNLYAALSNLPAPRNNWCLEFLMGGVKHWSARLNTPLLPFNTVADVDWATARKEGYALFFNLNIAKFLMEKAAPVPHLALPTASGTWPFRGGAAPGGQSPCEQSFGVTYLRPGAAAATPLPNDLVVPAVMAPYTLPAGSWIPAGGITAGGAPVPLVGGVAAPDPAGVLPLGTSLTAPVGLASGARIPAHTIIGGAAARSGLTLPTGEILVPRDFRLTVDLDLPAAGAVILPTHSLGLCLFGRPLAPGSPIGGPYVPFPNPPSPIPPNFWDWLRFPNGLAHGITGCRRPVFCTIRLNPNCPAAVGGTVEDQLIPIHCYHAPAAPFDRVRGLAAAAAAHSMYQAYDHAGAAWVMPLRVLFGGDLNEPLDPNNPPYTNFTDTFLAGGASCRSLGPPAVPGIRVLHAPPLGTAYADVPRNKTTIGTHNWGAGFPAPAILDNDPDQYRITAIDNIFFAELSPAQAPPHPFGDYYDLLTTIQNTAVPLGSNFSAGVIRALLMRYFREQAGFPWPGALPGWLPLGAFGGLNNRQVFFEPLTGSGLLGAVPGFYPPLPPAGTPGVTVPGVPNASRAAAEFVKLLVSDHLPVLFRMNV